MTLKQFLFEGATAGTAITNANASVIGASLVNLGGGTQTLTAAAAAHGSTGLELVTTATGQYNVSRFAANASNDKFAASAVFTYVGTGTGNAPTATARIIGILPLIGGVLSNSYYPVNLRVGAANQLIVADSVFTAIGPATPTLVPGTKYRIEIVGDRVAGSCTANLYPTTGTTTTAIATWSKASGANLGADPFGGIEIGNLSSNLPITVRVDDLQLNDGGTAEIGAYTVSATPLAVTLTITPNSGTVPYTQTFTATATGGTGVGRQFTFNPGGGEPLIGPQAGNTATHTVTVAGNYTASVTVTEP